MTARPGPVVQQDYWLYNLATLTTRRERGQRRPVDQVAAEIRAILSTGPAVLGLNEAVGHALPHVRGYQQVRDRTTESRANIAAYVRRDVPLTNVRWHDLEETWSRTQHDGQHPPRSFVSFHAGGCKVAVAHQAPKGTDNTIAAQTEGITVLAEVLDTKTVGRPALVLMDANRRRRETGPGPAVLARRLGGRVVGDRIDCAVVAGDVRVVEHRYVRRIRVDGRTVRLRSDHPHALRFTFATDARWLRAPQEER